MKMLNFDTDYLSKQYHLLNCLELWNHEMEAPFIISKRLFDQNITLNNDFSAEDSHLIYVDNELVGFVLVKHWTDERPLHENSHQTAWLSLIYVSKQHRRVGYGTMLLKAVESNLHHRGITRLELGKDTYNFLPGVPKQTEESARFFEHHGFDSEGYSYDLICHVDASTKPIELAPSDYTIRCANRRDFARIERFLAKHFAGRWHYEFCKYKDKGGSGKEFIIILDKQQVIGFCRLNHQDALEQLNNINWSVPFENLYGIGPLGIDASYRGQKLGFNITAFAINKAIEQGASDVVIDWTSKVDFYKKFNFDVWQSYHSMHKTLRGGQ